MNIKDENQLATHDEQQHEKLNHGKEMVTITIDDNLRSIHRGRQTVVELKTVGEVPLAYDIDEFVDGKFQPLPDDGSVTIKGGEIFISHPKDGSSS